MFTIPQNEAPESGKLKGKVNYGCIVPGRKTNKRGCLLHACTCVWAAAARARVHCTKCCTHAGAKNNYVHTVDVTQMEAALTRSDNVNNGDRQSA